MKLNKLTNKSVETLFKDVVEDFDTVKSKYFDLMSQDFDWVIGDRVNCVDGGIQMNHLNLIEEPSAEFDFENAKIFYSAIGKKLTPEDADDARLWVYLTHFAFLNYSRKRWGKVDISRETIIDRFFYKGNGRLSRTRNSVARLWWIPYLTFNPSGADDMEKWKYTQAAFSSQEVFVSLFERKLGTYSNIRKAFLDFIIDNQPQSKAVQYLARKINNLGGVYVLPYLDEGEVAEILSTEYLIYNQSPDI